METAASNATSNTVLTSALVSASASAPALHPSKGVKARQLTFDGTALLPSVSKDGQTIYFAKRERPGEIIVSRLGAKGEVTSVALTDEGSWSAAIQASTSTLAPGSIPVAPKSNT